MADQLSFFVHGLQYGKGDWVLPVMANPAQLRELVAAAGSLTSRMKNADEAAWKQLQAGQGFVTLSPEEHHAFSKRFAAHCEALDTLSKDASADVRQAAEKKIATVIEDAQKALQRHIEVLYCPILKDMEHNYLPLPADTPLSAFKHSEQKLLADLNNAQRIKDLPKWSSGLALVGTRSACLNFKKAPKNWLAKLSSGLWLVDAVIVAAGAALLFGLGAMSPLGWAIAGGMLLTTFVDKWQGTDSKCARLLGWFRRVWHGDYSKKNAVRQGNWKSWKPWVALAGIGLILFSAGAAAWKVFSGAMSATHAAFAAVYAVCVTSFTVSSLVGGFGKAFKQIDMPLWFDKIRDYDKPEMDRVAELADASVHTAALSPGISLDEENQSLRLNNQFLQQRLYMFDVMSAAASKERFLSTAVEAGMAIGQHEAADQLKAQVAALTAERELALEAVTSFTPAAAERQASCCGSQPVLTPVETPACESMQGQLPAKKEEFAAQQTSGGESETVTPAKRVTSCCG
jgi:hypothetical protein